MLRWCACLAGTDIDRQGATKLAEALAGNNIALTSLELSGALLGAVWGRGRGARSELRGLRWQAIPSATRVRLPYPRHSPTTPCSDRSISEVSEHPWTRCIVVESPSSPRRFHLVCEGEFGCAPVRMLGVAGNDISSKGATEVAKMLAGSTALTSLDLHSEYLWRWGAGVEGRQSGNGWSGSRRGA